MSLVNIVLRLSPKQEDQFVTKRVGGDEAEVCEIQVTYDNPKKSELLVELPLKDDKFISLQENVNDPKIWELCDKVKEWNVQ